MLGLLKEDEFWRGVQYLHGTMHELYNETERKVNIIMAQIDDENQALSDLEAQMSASATKIQTELDALQAKITAGATPTDLTAQIQKIKDLTTAAGNLGNETPTP